MLENIPLGQQCSPSPQHVASGWGQHPHCPEDSLQHVVPVAHDAVSLHFTLPTDNAVSSDCVSPLLHVPALTSHVYPVRG
jgi:hypothetical protein